MHLYNFKPGDRPIYKYFRPNFSLKVTTNSNYTGVETKIYFAGDNTSIQLCLNKVLSNTDNLGIS